jgi:hypothetical protein
VERADAAGLVEFGDIDDGEWGGVSSDKVQSKSNQKATVGRLSIVSPTMTDRSRRVDRAVSRNSRG